MKRLELLERLTNKMTLGNYSLDTIKAYTAVVNKFFSFLVDHPDCSELSHSRRIEEYLTWRVKEFDISPSTQNVEFNALIFLHRNVFEVEVSNINSLRARAKNRIPPILSREQISTLLDTMCSRSKLIARMMYGTGLRVNECLRLRVKDIDFEQMKIIVHEGKGDKESILPLPDALKKEIKAQLEIAKKLWAVDQAQGYGVNLPRALEAKYKTLGMSLDWYWFFPNETTAIDPRSQRRQRHHVYDFQVQKDFQDARKKNKLPAYTTPHAMRHAFATHFAQSMLQKGFPQSMVEARLMEYLRHASRETLKFYVHLAAPKDAVATLPIEEL